MLYMLLCILFMGMSFRLMFRTVTEIGEGRFTGNRLEVVALAMLPLALGSPFFVGFYTFDRTISLEQLSRLSSGAQWAGLAAAAILTVLYARRAWQASHRFWYSGLVVAGALLTFIFADSLQFVSRQDAGVMATFVLAEGNGNDVDCPQPAMLIHYSKGEPADWRCPKGIALMSDSSRPFVPWPDYHSGRSRHLTTVLDTLTDSAQRTERSPKS
ncbi:hypothetical protein DH20_14520 [Pantoea agglomerans]|nr:hypothetical protein [Pantoea agglomerans]